MLRLALVSCLGLAGLAWHCAGESAAQGAKRPGPDPKEWNETVDKAITYLKSSQAEDGSWSKQSNPGVTAAVVRALLRTGKMTAKDPAIEKALKFIESQANEEGHLAGKGKVRQVNYLTSINLLALAEADPQRYAGLIEKAVKFLKGQSLDEGRGKDRKDPSYGGFGYDATTRADMSNTVFTLEALRAGKLPASDPMWAKALVFVSRSQNLKSEHNDQPWADKINDGSFCYGAGPAGAGKGKAGEDPAAPRPGYGSITCAGILSLSNCGVKKDDPRLLKALEWIQKNYSPEKSPGTADGARGLYIYLFELSAALDRLGMDTVAGPDGKPRDWRTDVTAALRARQRKDGAWANSVGVWMEANPDLATSWALMALSYARPKEK